MRWLCGDVRWRGQRSVLDLALDLVQLSLEVRRQGEIVDRVAGAIVRDAECQCAGLELAFDHTLDRGEGRDVNLLQCARDHRSVRVFLVSVDSDAVDARFAGRLQHAESATSSNLELDVSSLVDLALGYA